jgi:ribonucleotide monophosphatase NagD (HAD superfamily)
VATYVGYAAERPPDVWVGKPSRDLAQLLVREHGLTPARTLMVGDRTNTDIAFGRSVGMRTCLVLSGCHTRADAAAAPPEATPEFVAESVADFAC